MEIVAKLSLVHVRFTYDAKVQYFDSVSSVQLS